MVFEISVLTNFVIFTGKHLCWSLFIKKRLQHICFPVNITKFVRTAFFIERLRWLLGNIWFSDIFMFSVYLEEIKRLTPSTSFWRPTKFLSSERYLRKIEIIHYIYTFIFTFITNIHL